MLTIQSAILGLFSVYIKTKQMENYLIKTENNSSFWTTAGSDVSKKQKSPGNQIFFFVLSFP